jgi:hypothetical protein
VVKLTRVEPFQANMSRSYKKVPGHYDRSPYHKRQANVKVRRFKDDPQDGGWYKKLYESWNIHDFRWPYLPMGRHYSYTRYDRPGNFRPYWGHEESVDPVMLRMSRSK